MKKQLFSLALGLSLSLAQPLSAQLRWGDQGNGTFINPVLNADYSDPDIIRVEDKYYMVASDFNHLGMQVLESSDMVNWTLISQIYDRMDYPGWDTNEHYGGGAWAPSIRWHDGRFYVYFCTPDEGLFMSTAEDAHGPWEPLHLVKGVEKWEDPCPFWDDNGAAYLGRSQWGAGPIIIHRMSADGKQLLDDGVTVYTGPVAEGTKFLKYNDYYYLVIPEGGVARGWQTVLRSKNIMGPYEKRVLLEQGSTDINGPHQGSLVDTPDGKWWFYHFQDIAPRGRVLHLEPVIWKDDWPLMGVDIDGNGIGEPVYVWKNPMPSVPSLPQTDDEFTGNEKHWVGQQQRALGLQWQWNHNPVDNAWSLDERKGWLTLKALKAEEMKDSRNMLTQKTMGYVSEATTKIDCSQLKNDTYAGLSCIGRSWRGVGVCQVDGKLWFYVEDTGHRELVRELKRKVVYLQLQADSDENEFTFLISEDGRNFAPVGETFIMRSANWKGARVGLYCYNTSTEAGQAQFDYFHYRILK